MEGQPANIEVEYRGEMKSFKPEEISSMVLSKMKEIVAPPPAKKKSRNDVIHVLLALFGNALQAPK